MGDEVELLRQQLDESRSLVKQYQKRLHDDQIKTNHTITSLKMQIYEQQVRLDEIECQKDKRFQTIVSQLLLLESRIKRERQQIQIIIRSKQESIDNLEREKQEMSDKNERLSFVVNVLSRTNKSSFAADSVFDSTENLAVSPGEREKTHKGRFHFMKSRLKRHRSSLDLQMASDSFLQSPQNQKQRVTEIASDIADNVILRQSKQKNSRDRCHSTPSALQHWSDTLECNKYVIRNGAIPEEDFNCIESQENEFQICDITLNGDHNVTLDSNSSCGNISARSNSVTSLDSKVSSILDDSLELKKQDKASDSNPLKSIKSMMKRKGSKNKGKNRPNSLPQFPNGDKKGKNRSMSLPQCTSEQYQMMLTTHYIEKQKRL